MSAPMRPRHAALALAALLGSGALATGCGKPKGNGPGGMVVPVVGFAAKQQPLEETIALVGTLEANERVDIKSELAGRIEEIAFEEGQRVTQGQVLIRIDRTELDASLAQAEADLQLAASTHARYAALAESRAVSQQEVDQASASLAAKQAALELVKAQLEDATITAPFDGVAGERLVSLGQYVAIGAPLTTVIDADPMKAAFDVPEHHFAQLQAGQAIQLTVAAYPDAQFQGEVYFVDPQVRADTRTVLVKALVPNADGRLRPGMFASLRLVTQVRARALVIPESAILLQGQTTSLFVVKEGGVVEPRVVTAGVRLAGMVEITSGLQAGEMVIVEGVQKVFPGATVSVRPEAP